MGFKYYGKGWFLIVLLCSYRVLPGFKDISHGRILNMEHTLQSLVNYQNNDWLHNFALSCTAHKQCYTLSRGMRLRVLYECTLQNPSS